MYILEVNSQTKYEFYILLRHCKLFRACALFRFLCKTKIVMNKFKGSANKLEDLLCTIFLKTSIS